MQGNEIKTILQNVIYLYLVQGLNYLLPILVLPYLIKTLSVESFGIYSFAFAFSQFVLLFVDFGFNISATKKIAEHHNDALLVKDTFWNIISIKMVFCLFSLFCTFILTLTVAKIHFYSDAILWSFIMIIGTVFFPLWWFQGLNKMREMSIINALSKLLSYPLIFIFVKKADDYNAAILIQSLSFLFAAFFSFMYLFKFHGDYFMNNVWVKSRKIYIEEIKNSWGIFLSNSSINLYTNSLTILLGFFSTNYNVGVFGAMERIVRVICFGVLIPINQACFPLLVQMKKENFAKAKKLFKMIVLVVLGLISLAYITFLLCKGIIIDRFLSGYHGIDTMFNFFMLMIFPIALGGVIGQLGLLGLGGEKEKKIFSKIYVWVGLFSIPLSMICIKYYHLWGTISAIVIVEIVIFLLMFFRIIHFFKINND